MSNYVSLMLAGLWALGCSGPRPTVARATGREGGVEVSFAGAGGLRLSGTLLMPQSAKSVPALLLLPGSGPTDRDGNSSLGITTDILKQIAEALATQGVATLRFDKRAVQRYRAAWPKDPAKLNSFFSYRNFVLDAEAGYRFLREQKGVDPKRVGLLGHSEGALFCLQIGADLSGTPAAPRALILLGSTGRPMGPILHEQIARALEKHAVPDPTRSQYLEYVDSACTALAKGRPLPPHCPPGLLALFNPTVTDIVGAYCRIDPSALARRVKGPVLVVNGADDTQVSATRDAPRLFAALKSRPNGVQELLVAPGASHNLKSTADGDKDAIDGPVSAPALAAILDFAKRHLAR